MDAWLQFGLSNALIATLMALVVAAVTRMWPSAPLARALWLVVLVKLITPPVWQVAIPIAAEPPAGLLAASSPMGPAANTSDAPQVTPEASRPASDSIGQATASAAEPSSGNRDLRAWTVMLGRAARDGSRELVSLWLAGMVAWLSVFAVRVCRFQRIARDLPPADDWWQRETAAMARRLGMRTWPEVRLAAGAIPPILWAGAVRPAILLPRELVERLDAAGRRALVAHELVHYYRRDHLVRWFEMFVLAVYWWLPVAWWARRRLQTAEEVCCDAWSVWLVGGDARAYGRTLLAAIEFLSQRRPALPAGASGLGGRSHLIRRFEMLLQHAQPRQLSRWGWGVVAAFAICALPLYACAVVEAGPPRWARLSPFTEVHVEGAAARVKFDGQFYELVSIDGILTARLLAAARNQFGDLWEKRFVEDLVEVMDGLGSRPGPTVTLVLLDLEDNVMLTVKQAPMTAENRLAVYLARHAKEIAELRQRQVVMASGDDEKRIREVVRAFAEASRRNDLAALAKTLGEHPNRDQRNQNYLKNTRELLDKGAEIDELSSIVVLPREQAMAVTDFFALTEPRAGMFCVVYNLVQQDGAWIVHDIDLEDVGGLVDEVARTVTRAAKAAE